MNTTVYAANLLLNNCGVKFSSLDQEQSIHFRDVGRFQGLLYHVDNPKSSKKAPTGLWKLNKPVMASLIGADFKGRQASLKYLDVNYELYAAFSFSEDPA